MKSRASFLRWKRWTSALTASARSLKVSKMASIRHVFISHRWLFAKISVQYDLCERIHVGHEKDEDADQRGQGNAVPEDVAQNVAFMPIPLGRGAGDDDALRVNHLAHHASGSVGR